jgi:hypothetical protein
MKGVFLKLLHRDNHQNGSTRASDFYGFQQGIYINKKAFIAEGLSSWAPPSGLEPETL